MPRKPEQTTERTIAQAQAQSRKALADRGGKVVQVRLEAAEVAMLDDLRYALHLRYDREVIAYALGVAHDSLKIGKTQGRRKAVAAF